MGYSMSMRDCNFTIIKSKFEPAKEALRGLADSPENGSGYGNGKRHFAWVNDDFKNKNTLVDMVFCWRWLLYIDERTGNIGSISFEGEKYGDDDVLFQTLAPFVKRGSYIVMSGEDGAIWRWKFDGKSVVNQSGRVTFR